MKYIYPIIILFFNLQVTYCQKLFVDKVTLFNVTNSESNDILFGSLADGPILKFYISIINDANSEITLCPSTTQLDYTYKCQGINVKQNILVDIQLYSFTQQDSLILNPMEQIKLEFSSKVFLKTKFIQSRRTELDSYNYTKEMIEVLGTLKLNYSDTNINLETYRIDEVCFN